MNSGIDELLGVVLCGGESRRMGRDKGLLERDGIPWATRMGGKLKPWPLPVVYSINERQQAAYSVFLSPEQLIVDSLRLPGPLNGLLSVHRRFPIHDLLLLACDMQDLEWSSIGMLIDTYRLGVSEEYPPLFYIYRDDHFLQPFCGIYTAAGLRPVYRRAATGTLVDLSLRALLTDDRVRHLRIANSRAFRNYNSL